MRMLATLCAVVLLAGLPQVLAAPANQSSIDPRALALTTADLQAGYGVVQDRTRLEDRPDGAAVFETVFMRQRTPANLAAGPIEIGNGVARTASAQSAEEQLRASRDASVADGWQEVGVPPLGEQALGLSKIVDVEGGRAGDHLYLFRDGPWVMLIRVYGREDVTKLSDTVPLAIVVADRLSAAVKRGSASAPVLERVRVANADGARVNARAEPTTGAPVIEQVAEGTELDVAGPDRDVDGRVWRNVRLADGRTGWIVSTYLVALPPPPTATPGSSDSPPARTGSPVPQRGTPTPSERSSEPAAKPSASGSTTNRGGLSIEVAPRHAELSSGDQAVRVRVTRDGRGVANARVDVTARLNPRQYFSINAPRTDDDGRTEVAWKMEGPPGTYQVIVEVRPTDDADPVEATSSFKWQP
jgi:Bacterial SH3 domain